MSVPLPGRWSHTILTSPLQASGPRELFSTPRFAYAFGVEFSKFMDPPSMPALEFANSVGVQQRVCKARSG